MHLLAALAHVGRVAQAGAVASISQRVSAQLEWPPPRKGTVHKHLLIIDDSEPDLLYGQIVAERAGIVQRVSSQESAREALAFLQQPAGCDVDLIFLDINMPGMDGFGFLKAFEALDTYDQARAPVVVMLTSSPDTRDRERAFGFKSVRDYLIKPISIEQARQMQQRLESAGERS